MTRPNRMLLALATIVTLPALAWYGYAWMVGRPEQADNAKLVLLGSTVLWTAVLFYGLVAGPIEARMKRKTAARP